SLVGIVPDETAPVPPLFGTVSSGTIDSAEEDLGLGVLLGADQLELAGALDQGDADDVGAAEGDHGAEVLLGDRVDGVQPEAGGQPAVERRRGAAALDVAQCDGPLLGAGALLDLRRGPVTDAAEPDMAE